MKLGKIHHIAIIVSDYEISKEFYVHKLGFQVMRHLAFTVDNIEEAVIELESMGIQCEPIRMDEITDKKMTFFHDPDGLPLELHE